MTGQEFDPAFAERYLGWLINRNHSELAKVTPDRHAALRMIRALVASEVPDWWPVPDQRRVVSRIHLVARRIAAYQLRLAFDGDRYHVIAPAEEQLGLWSRPISADATGTLPVLGSASNLADLATEIERITDRIQANQTDDGTQ
ncbi:hypothetical protein HQ535_10270 [bacterium]|nr:hypothetical protein [bacterium]